MIKPTPEQIAKLPKWAIDHIQSLEIYRNEAVRSLNRFLDNQTESNVWVSEHPCTGEQQGPRFIKHFIQADRIHFCLGPHREIEVGLDGSELKVSGLGFHGQLNLRLEMASILKLAKGQK
jgi:hypothetical protein